jgi:D-sedoheptulose 7-phosphate isomerase
MSIDARDAAFLADYQRRLAEASAIDATRAAQIAALRDAWLAARRDDRTVYFLGNGGSAGIAAHLAVDLSKNGRVRAHCFDAATVTCLANDHGHENWMKSALSIWSRPGDVAVVISSSGRSANALNAADFAAASGRLLVTLSGMAADNPLRAKGSISLWCDSRAYNVIETAHQFWLMAALDMLIGSPEYAAS